MTPPMEELVHDLLDRSLTDEGLILIGSEDLSDLRSEGYSPIDFFDHLSKSHNYLLHGSTNEFTTSINPTKFERIGEPDKVKKYHSKSATFATPFGSMAIAKAILSNKSSRLNYSWWIRKPLHIEIENITEDTIQETGFIYLINGRSNFTNGSHYLSDEQVRGKDLNRCVEWVRTDGETTPFTARVEVSKADLLPYHNIIDVSTGERILE